MDWPTDPSAVVSLEGFRKRREKKDACQHERYILDTECGTVECADCGAIVSAFHALKKIAFHESQAFRKLSGMRKEIAEIMGRRSWLKAVQELDRLWRGKRMLPSCPHCKQGLFAEDFAGSAVGVEYEKARRRRASLHIPADDRPEIAGLKS